VLINSGPRHVDVAAQVGAKAATLLAAIGVVVVQAVIRQVCLVKDELVGGSCAMQRHNIGSRLRVCSAANHVSSWYVGNHSAPEDAQTAGQVRRAQYFYQNMRDC
jgi:hypothetical protein